MRKYIFKNLFTFEVPLVNELWMLDFSPGPFLHLAGHKRLPPLTCALSLDDHSRAVTYYLRKWDGLHPNKKFLTPFNCRDLSPREWVLDPELRQRNQIW